MGNVSSKEKQNYRIRNCRQFLAIIASATLLLGASFGIQAAYAVTQTPNYKIAVSNPTSSGCEFEGPGDQYKRCVQKSISGTADTWVRHQEAFAHWAQVYHEMNPSSPGTPSTNFVYTADDNCGRFVSELHGNGFIDDESGLNADARYGGNIFWKNGFGLWQFEGWFYAAKTNEGSFTIPNDTEVILYSETMATNSQWTMGSLFESLVDGGFSGGSEIAESDVYDVTRGWTSEHLQIDSFCPF